MRAIWKVQLHAPGLDAHLPRGASIVHVHEQDGNPTLWAEVDPDEASLVHRRFAVIMTGQHFSPDPNRYVYLGTCHLPGGIVAHVYEIEVVG
jgi:hypothetical protein